LKQLFDLESKLSGIVSASSSAALEVHSAREQLEEFSKSAQPNLKQPIENLDKELGALLRGKEQSASAKEQSAAADEAPGLDDLTGEAGSLYSQIGQADAPPTAAQRQAADHTSEELSEVLSHWQRLKGSSIPEVNRQLRNAHLRELDLEQKPKTMPESGDED
jgi:hypothetical protein